MDIVIGIPGNRDLAGNKESFLAATLRRNYNPDLVVVISHMGNFQDRKFASCSIGIDVIVGASRQPMPRCRSRRC